MLWLEVVPDTLRPRVDVDYGHDIKDGVSSRSLGELESAGTRTGNQAPPAPQGTGGVFVRDPVAAP